MYRNKGLLWHLWTTSDDPPSSPQVWAAVRNCCRRVLGGVLVVGSHLELHGNVVSAIAGINKGPIRVLVTVSFYALLGVSPRF